MPDGLVGLMPVRCPWEGGRRVKVLERKCEDGAELSGEGHLLAVTMGEGP